MTPISSRRPASTTSAPVDVIDPVCGAALAPGQSFAERWHDMAIHHMCSRECLDAFVAAPAHYAARAAARAALARGDVDSVHVEAVDDDGRVRGHLADGTALSFHVELDLVAQVRRMIAAA